MFSTNENIIHVSSKLKLPYWWVESIAIEYLNCREFAEHDEIWSFNFDLISKQELIEAVQTEKIVVSSPIIQYPPIGEGLLKSLKNYFLGQDYIAEPGSIIEGLVSHNDFPDEVEFLDFMDLYSHFLIISRFTMMENSGSGKSQNLPILKVSPTACGFHRR